jgi:hypothetical protein
MSKIERTYEDSALKSLCEALAHCGEVTQYRGSHYFGATNSWIEYETPQEDWGFVGYGDAMNVCTDVKWNCLFIPAIMTFSDYSGSTVERSNCEWFLEEYKETVGVYEMTGGYGTTGVAIKLSAITEEMIELFQGMQNYCAIDEDHMSNLEMEIENEDWDNWIRGDFKRELEKKFQPEEADEDTGPVAEIDAMSDEALHEALHELLRTLMERANEYPIFEDAVSCFIHLDRCVAVCTRQDILDAHESDKEERARAEADAHTQEEAKDIQWTTAMTGRIVAHGTPRPTCFTHPDVELDDDRTCEKCQAEVGNEAIN